MHLFSTFCVAGPDCPPPNAIRVNLIHAKTSEQSVLVSRISGERFYHLLIHVFIHSLGSMGLLESISKSMLGSSIQSVLLKCLQFFCVTGAYWITCWNLHSVTPALLVQIRNVWFQFQSIFQWAIKYPYLHSFLQNCRCEKSSRQNCHTLA